MAIAVDNQVYFYDIRTWQQYGKYDSQKDEFVPFVISNNKAIYTVCFSPDHMLFASGGEDKQLVVRDVVTWNVTT